MCSHPNGTVDKPWNPCLFPWNGCFLPWNGCFLPWIGLPLKITKLCPKLREYKSEVETGEKRWKKGVHIKRKNKPSPEGEGESLPLKLVFERYHPTHPSQPTHRAHGYKWCVRLVCVQVQGTLSSHPTHPVCSASMCASARHVIIPPPTPPTPCMDTSDVFG